MKLNIYEYEEQKLQICKVISHTLNSYIEGNTDLDLLTDDGAYADDYK